MVNGGVEKVGGSKRGTREGKRGRENGGKSMISWVRRARDGVSPRRRESGRRC